MHRRRECRCHCFNARGKYEFGLRRTRARRRAGADARPYRAFGRKRCRRDLARKHFGMQRAVDFLRSDRKLGDAHADGICNRIGDRGRYRIEPDFTQTPRRRSDALAPAKATCMRGIMADGIG